ncbi:MAG: hypothetical protein O3A63_04655 [Proteobacteria bacterium]|nr:hypothetical protein [Pseudomonadota bacterium]
MFGFFPLQFRFRNKLNRLRDMVQCFRQNPGIGLHPTQIARLTGISFAEVVRRLDATPELFVKLPRRPDGITRYRLTSTTAARSDEDIEKFLVNSARRESFLLYALGIMLLCAFVIVITIVGPVL